MNWTSPWGANWAPVAPIPAINPRRQAGAEKSSIVKGMKCRVLVILPRTFTKLSFCESQTTSVVVREVAARDQVVAEPSTAPLASAFPATPAAGPDVERVLLTIERRAWYETPIVRGCPREIGWGGGRV